MSLIFSRTPVGPVDAEQPLRVADVDQRQRAVVFEVARVEDREHRELLQPRHDAGRRDLALRRDQRDLLAQRDAAARARVRRRARCRTRRRPAPSAARRAPAVAMSDTSGSAAGSTPRISTPRTLSPRVSSACALTYGAAPITSGFLRAACAVRLPVRQRAVGREHLDVRDAPTACGRAPATRSRSSPTARRSAPSRRARCRASRCRR